MLQQRDGRYGQGLVDPKRVGSEGLFGKRDVAFDDAEGQIYMGKRARVWRKVSSARRMFHEPKAQWKLVVKQAAAIVARTDEPMHESVVHGRAADRPVGVHNAASEQHAIREAIDWAHGHGIKH